MQEEAKVAKADGQVGHASAEIEKERIISQLIEITAIPQAERYFQSQGDLLCKFCRKPGHLFRNCSEKEIQCLRYVWLFVASCLYSRFGGVICSKLSARKSY